VSIRLSNVLDSRLEIKHESPRPCSAIVNGDNFGRHRVV
jgi:hypothetical protein